MQIHATKPVQRPPQLLECLPVRLANGPEPEQSCDQGYQPSSFGPFEPFVDEHIVARFLQITPRRALEMARKGEIPAHPIGRTRRTWRFRISEIDAHFSAPKKPCVLRFPRQFPEPRKGNVLGKGTVSKKQRANGVTWGYRFQTTRPLDGRQVENTKVVGLVKEIGSPEIDAWLEVGRLGLNINLEQFVAHKPTFMELAEHFCEHELRKQSGIAVKAPETVVIAQLNCPLGLAPDGEKKASDIKPLEIEIMV